MNSINYKYTFLVPAFKANFFYETLNSIKNQTYQNFKVIISDDCSPAPLKPIYDKFSCDPRFIYRRNENNMGARNLVSHWNLLVDICDTEYLILASDDDIYDKDFLKEVDKLTQKYPEVDLIHTRVKEIDQNNNIIRKDAIYEEKVTQLEFISQYEYFNHIECVANNVFRTAALKLIGGFKEYPLAWTSDTVTSFLMARNGVANTRQLLFSFRMSGLNISSINNERKEISQKKFEAIKLYNKDVIKIINLLKPKNKYDIKLRDTVLKYHKKHVYTAATYYSISLSWKKFIHFIIEFKNEGFFENNYQIYQLIKKKCMNH